MDPQEVRQYATQLTAQISLLEAAADSVRQVLVASAGSAEPTGALAPMSISDVQTAHTNLLLSVQAITELTRNLHEEATQQEDASSAADNSYEKGWLPKVVDNTLTPEASLEPFKTTLDAYGYVSNSALIVDRVVGTAAIYKALPDADFDDYTKGFKDVKGAPAADILDADSAFQNINKVSKFLNETPVGKTLGVVGIGASAISAVSDFSQGKVTDGIEDTIETGLGVAALVTPPPADAVFAIAAVAVGVTQYIQDHPEVQKAIGNVVSSVGSVATNIGKGVGDAVGDVGKGLASAFGSLF
jgi:hypothetical protein